ncbi:hypothetical protein LMG28688_00774 [Paraburkholderia caffeinitolerans]|uniref:DUF1566 domain-containing protein n=1 Tax=Paraburkholderia caffeinitolerans TaxID=1723730 RepID=A0A6J5FJW7_9BURK|nr:DUF1566 domain-containing protein [Paraburkholderia caffeinitolerans]CAB3779237.1 hypothetical protein LMG28688_00774 [Paraburkholderia caffeinitolerans]
MTITLEQIEADHARISALIEEFKKQPKATEYIVAGVKIPLAPGERYAGLVLGQNGEPDYHLILISGEIEDAQWGRACEWAIEQGGELPTRSEQSLLFANLKGEFEAAYYWSGERHETNSGWAWYQYFGNGYQYYSNHRNELRARAVRRFIPSVI